MTKYFLFLQRQPHHFSQMMKLFFNFLFSFAPIPKRARSPPVPLPIPNTINHFCLCRSPKFKKDEVWYMYIIKINGIEIEVSEDVYYTYYKGLRKERYFMSDLKYGRTYKDAQSGEYIKMPPREISIDALNDQGYFFQDTTDVETFVLQELLKEKLRKALMCLTDSELELIYALFYEDISAAEFARRNGVSRKTIINRKEKILRKLKKEF